MPQDSARMMMYDAQKKSALVAYLLWWFLGWFGAHRFYLGRSGSGVAMLFLVPTGMIMFLVFFPIGMLMLLGPTLLWFADIVLVGSMVEKYNLSLAQHYSGAGRSAG